MIWVNTSSWSPVPYSQRPCLWDPLPMNRQAPAQGHHSPAASCVRNWPHPLVGQHQSQDPQGPASRDPRTQLHPPVTQHWSQNTQGFGLTHQQLDTPPPRPSSFCQWVSNPPIAPTDWQAPALGCPGPRPHPPMGRHQPQDHLGPAACPSAGQCQLWDTLGPSASSLGIQSHPSGANISFRTSRGLRPEPLGPISAHQSACTSAKTTPPHCLLKSPPPQV